jgi:RND family efflux transporter MFP subunit
MTTKRMFPLAALVLFSFTLGCSTASTKEKPPKPVKVKPVETQSTGSNAVRYSASIKPATQVEVAFKVSGYVDAIARTKDSAGQWRHIQAGDIVHKGVTLARVRQSDYVAKVNEAKSQHGEANSALEANKAQLKEAIAAVETARAQVTDAKASFDRASLDFERARILFGTQSMTKPDYDAAKAQHEIAAAKLEAARGQLRSAEARVASAQAQISAAESRIKTAEATTVSATIPLQDTQLKAPMSAVVIERKVEMGTLVSQGTPAFVVADLSFVKAAFGVPDLALQGVKLGDALLVTTDGVPGREFRGHISRISPSADQNSRVFEVEVTIPNPDGALKPGMIASLSVNEGTGTSVEVPVVPLTAITRARDDSNSYAVFVIENRDGKHFARTRTVTLGDSFGNAVAIKSGVKPGETVITTGAGQVADGEEVQIIP